MAETVTPGNDEREIELMRAFLGERGLLPPVPGRYAAADEDAADLLGRILAAGPTTPPATPRAAGAGRRADDAPTAGRAGTRRRRRLLVAGAAAAVIVVGGGAFGLLRGTPAAASTTPPLLDLGGVDLAHLDAAPPASEVLADAAASAAIAPAEAGSGDVQYVATYGWFLDAQAQPAGPVQAALYPTVTRWWLAADGSVRIDQHRGAALDLQGRATVDDVPAAADVASDTVPPGTIDAGLAGRLPTDPTALRGELLATQAGLPCDQDARWEAECLVRGVQTLYDQYVVGPQLASALWTVLSDEATLRSLGPTEDRLGRPAVAVALPSEPGADPVQVTVLLVSPESGGYLGSETVTLREPLLDIDEPTVTQFSVLSTAAWVPAVGVTP